MKEYCLWGFVSLAAALVGFSALIADEQILENMQRFASAPCDAVEIWRGPNMVARCDDPAEGKRLCRLIAAADHVESRKLVGAMFELRLTLDDGAILPIQIHIIDYKQRIAVIEQRSGWRTMQFSAPGVRAWVRTRLVERGDLLENY